MSNRKIVFIVDDSATDLHLCRGMLREEFEIRVAMSGRTALRTLDTLRPDIILLDIEMPGMSGFEVMAEINKKSKLDGIPVIFITSHATKELVTKAFRHGVVDYLLKPFRADLLHSKIRMAFTAPPRGISQLPSSQVLGAIHQKRQIIMFVDDNPTNLTLGKNMLQDFYEVYALPSAERFFTFLEMVTPDLILLDVRMPDMDGYEVIKILKADARYADIPVIFVTTKALEMDELKGLELGAADYVTKPFSAAILLKRIENHLLLRKAMEAKAMEAKDAENSIRLILDSTPLICILRDEINNVIDCNREALDVFGFSEKSELIKNFGRLYPEFQPDGSRSINKARNIVNDLLNNGSIENFEWTYQTLDGETISLEIKLVLVPWKDTYRIMSYANDGRNSKEPSRLESRSALPEGIGHVQVGAFDFYSFSDDTGEMKNDALLTEDTEAVTRLSPNGKTPIGFSVFLVKKGSDTVLIDAGKGGKTLEFLRAIGVQAEDIKNILLTHSHGDHVNGLVREGQKVFPNATLWLDQDELAFWQSAHNRNHYEQCMTLYGDPKILSADEQNAVIFPELVAVALPGHTPGHTGFLLSSEGVKLFIVADLLHHGAVQFAKPNISVRYDHDPGRAAEVRCEALRRAAEEDFLVAGSHLPFPSIGSVSIDGNGFRFESIE